MKRWRVFAAAFMACLLSCALFPVAGHAASSVDDVKAKIAALSEDPRDYGAADRAKVGAIEAAYESLSAADQKTLDSAVAPGQSQPYGRVLESAVWAVAALAAPDNATTLPNGTYDAATTPALSCEYSKGKSTSSRQRPWSAKSVTVKDGKAFAAITVESSSYSALITGGKTYGRVNASGNSVFENVPIDLNGTIYFAGVSDLMPRPIMFSLTTAIDESASDGPVGGDDETGIDAVKALIEKLPSDPWRVTQRDAEAIGAAEAAYEALPAADRKTLDATALGRQSYGRALEQAVWALKALGAIDNSTTLADGEYTGKVKSASSTGKSVSARNSTFTVQKVTVQDGKATALIQYSGTSADLVLTGGQTYRHVNTDEGQPSQFEVPVKLNEPLYLVSFAKNPTESTIGLTYKMTTSADEANMKPDEKAAGTQGGGSGGGSQGGAGASGSGGSGVSSLVPHGVSSVVSAVQATAADAAGTDRPKAASSNSGASVQVGADASARDVSLALVVLLIACPLVTLVLGAALFALWFARREVVPPVIECARVK